MNLLTNLGLIEFYYLCRISRQRKITKLQEYRRLEIKEKMTLIFKDQQKTNQYLKEIESLKTQLRTETNSNRFKILFNYLLINWNTPSTKQVEEIIEQEAEKFLTQDCPFDSDSEEENFLSFEEERSPPSQEKENKIILEQELLIQPAQVKRTQSEITGLQKTCKKLKTEETIYTEKDVEEKIHHLEIENQRLKHELQIANMNLEFEKSVLTKEIERLRMKKELSSN